MPRLRKNEKIMKRTIKHSIRCLLGAVLLLGVSCIRDEYPASPGSAGGGSEEMTVELRLHANDGLFGGTRSATYDRERYISNALVLFFRGENSNAPLYGVSEGRNLPAGDSDGTVTFQASLVVESQYANDPFTCVVLANMLDRTLSTSLNGTGTTLSLDALRSCIGMNYNQIQAALAESVNGAMLTGTTDYFPMYGRASAPLVPAQTASLRLSVPLIRSVARVQLYNNASANFTLTEAYVFRATDKMSLIPLWDALGSGSTVVSKPSIPSGAAPIASSSAWKYTVSGNMSQGTIYLPEADTHISGTGAAPGDANHTSRCAMVVGGSYKGGATSYYRIDFTTTSDDVRTLLDVLRNHSYNITISAVHSAGESSPVDAYESQTANIDASVIEWTDENQDIVFDGTNWASVNRKRIEFADGANLEALLNVLSNVKPSEWTMSLDGAQPAGTASSTAATPSSDATIRGTYFSVTKPADSDDGAASQGGDVVIRTLQANTTSTVPDDGPVVPGVTYEETLHIYIGRLEIIVTLVQNPYEDIPWEDGGEFEGEFS